MPKTYISDSRCNSLICLWELHNMTSFPHFLLKLNQTWSKVSLLSSCKSECTTPVFWNPATTFLSLSFLSTSALNFLSLSVPFFQPLLRPPFPPRPDCSIQSGRHLSPLKRPLLTLRQDLLAAIFQHLHLLAAYLTPHMITGTICRHSHLFLFCREALWPDESKMLPASNKCSTRSPVNKHYKCSVPENGNATSCHKPKLQTSQLTERE